MTTTIWTDEFNSNVRDSHYRSYTHNDYYLISGSINEARMNGWLHSSAYTLTRFCHATICSFCFVFDWTYSDCIYNVPFVFIQMPCTYLTSFIWSLLLVFESKHILIQIQLYSLFSMMDQESRSKPRRFYSWRRPSVLK